MHYGRYAVVIFGGLLLGIAPNLRAGETTTYSYDELGRLIVSTNSGGPRNGRETVISLDPAGNRKSYVSGLPAPPQTNSAIFSIAAAAPVNEGAAAVFTITKTGTAFTAMTVNFATANGSAVADQDYTPENATLTFLPSETVKYHGVATVWDQVAEPSEQFTASLSSPSAGGSLATSIGGATINASAGPNQSPIVNPDPQLAVKCGTYVAYNVIANDTDPEGDVPLELVSVSGSVHASRASATEIGFSAPYSRNALFSATYTIRDARGAIAMGTLPLKAIGTAAECSFPAQVQTPSEGG